MGIQLYPPFFGFQICSCGSNDTKYVGHWDSFNVYKCYKCFGITGLPHMNMLHFMRHGSPSRIGDFFLEIIKPNFVDMNTGWGGANVNQQGQV